MHLTDGASRGLLGLAVTSVGSRSCLLRLSCSGYNQKAHHHACIALAAAPHCGPRHDVFLLLHSINDGR